MKFTIDMATWLRGEGSKESFLFRPRDQKMCCLGHILCQAGVPQDRLDSVPSPVDLLDTTLVIPEDIASVLTGESAVGLSGNSTLASEAMAINDDEEIDDEERISSLRDLFMDADVELEFV